MSALAVSLVTIGRDTARTGLNATRAVETRTAMTSAVEIAATAIWRQQFPLSGQMSWRQGGSTLRVTASPENGRIDLNGASDDLIEGLAAAVADDPQAGLALGHAILDWRDVDGERRLAGAEAADYARAGGIGRPRDGPFHFKDELRSVLGMDPGLYGRLAQAVTVHHGNDEPSVGPFSPLVQEALDRARGLAAERQDPEMTSDPAAEPLDAADGSGPAPSFSSDPSGLYTFDIELAHDDGPTFRQQTVIWIDPPLGIGRYAVLQNRSTILPEAAAGTAGDEASWPGR